MSSEKGKRYKRRYPQVLSMRVTDTEREELLRRANDAKLSLSLYLRTMTNLTTLEQAQSDAASFTQAQTAAKIDSDTSNNSNANSMTIPEKMIQENPVNPVPLIQEGWLPYR